MRQARLVQGPNGSPGPGPGQDDRPSPAADGLTHPSYRADIDGLRALAVMAVMIYHAFPKGMKGGYTGVDAFFVISGFLISSIIFKSLEGGCFSVAHFYSRRIRRIFPALALVLAASLAFGFIALLADEFQRLGWHVLAGAGFVANFAYWAESGYFDISAKAKPLLHLWSLGVEEQFYIVWPLLAWLGWRLPLRPLLLVSILALASFALALLAMRTTPVAAFYAPHLRFWELLAGALLAASLGRGVTVPLFAQHSLAKAQHLLNAWRLPSLRLGDLASVVGLALLVFGFVAINKKVAFPGATALVPVMGTALLIAAGPLALVNRKFLAQPALVWLGLISYPLYLWHWPLLSFARIVEDSTPTRWLRLILLVIAVVLAWLTMRFVERPLRFGGSGRLKVGLLLAMLLLIAGTGLGVYHSQGLPERLQAWQARKTHAVPNLLQDPGYTRSPRFAQVFGQVAPIKTRDFMLTAGPADQPRLAILGDSHANRLHIGLAEVGELALLNLGRGTCPPLLDVDITLIDGEAFHCQPLTRQTLDYAMASPEVSALLLNAFYAAYDRDVLMVGADGGAVDLPQALALTLAYVLQGGKPVVLVLDVPEVPRGCYKSARRFPVWQVGEPALCLVPQAQQQALNAQLLSALTPELRAHPLLTILDSSEVLCRKGRCGEIDPGNYLYTSDGNHLNALGTKRVGAWLAARLRPILAAH